MRNSSSAQRARACSSHPAIVPKTDQVMASSLLRDWRSHEDQVPAVRAGCENSTPAPFHYHEATVPIRNVHSTPSFSVFSFLRSRVEQSAYQGRLPAMKARTGDHRDLISVDTPGTDRLASTPDGMASFTDLVLEGITAGDRPAPACRGGRRSMPGLVRVHLREEPLAEIPGAGEHDGLRDRPCYR